MEFLGYSQTFLGVLASLFVVCIVLNPNNFIYNVLKNIENRIQDEIKDYDNNVSNFNKIEDLENEFGYRFLVQYINNNDEKDITDNDEKDITGKKNESLTKKAMEKEMEIRTRFNQLKSRSSDEIIRPAFEILNGILTSEKTSKEWVIAPLYALFCCIVLFICDELLMGLPFLCDAVVSYLAIFFSISIIFWIIIWVNFLSRIYSYNSKNFEIDFVSQKKSNNKKLNWKWISSGIIICFICWWCALYIPFIWLKQVIALGVGILCPVIIAFYKLSRDYESPMFTSEFCVNHFLLLSFISLLYTIIISIFVNYIDNASYCCISYTDMYPLKIIMIVVVLIIGLILPLIMPIIGCKLISKLLKNKLHEGNVQIQEEIKKLKDDIYKFCSSLLQ